ncbi:M20/M25/M40 family metallo-hydrolase [Mucilaginibacter sp. JRF]|uniref:M20/M25/M40 family metallo-hydrolase n=1 Tax=Mucilaginibacter sp. JRF TaxID=2780088 RepID=UPI00187F6E5C|nr:M20/M25/M40 family metallo-hydrolase [Mucilaginibacter sp. JRF]MBE9584712.1 M20/M25/M40 family metallo-hydrolase [Mucilaginibacter sp. JRF]
MIKNFLVAGLLLSATAGTQAQNVNKLIDQEDVGRIIKTLAADDMQGRGSFTPGIDKAAKFIEGEFKKIGLKPLAGEKDFRQSFSVVRSTPVNIQVSINGKPVLTENAFASAGASFKWTAASGAEVATLAAGQDFRTEYRKYTSSGKNMLILVDPSFANFFGRLRGRAMDGGVSMKVDSSQALVFVLGKFDNVSNYEVSYEVKNEEAPLFNVAGMIKGKSKPDEYVVFSGHYDHLGVIKPTEQDSIANGADDDASGTTAVIALAKYYKKLNNNARTLIFVAFTAEEIGGYGSQYFSNKVDPDKTVAMFNIEMIGKASKFGTNSAFITGYERSDFGTILQKNLEGTAFKFHPDPYPDQQLFYRSDNATLARHGVPAHTISTDQIDIDKLYHTVKDEFGSLDVSNITSTIRAIALSSRSIVAGKDTPTRIPKMED